VTEQPQPDRRQPEPPKSAVGAGDAASAAKPAEGTPASQLTPEEQMALFEKELKENDWGHQPC